MLHIPEADGDQMLLDLPIVYIQTHCQQQPLLISSQNFLFIPEHMLIVVRSFQVKSKKCPRSIPLTFRKKLGPMWHEHFIEQQNLSADRPQIFKIVLAPRQVHTRWMLSACSTSLLHTSVNFAASYLSAPSTNDCLVQEYRLTQPSNSKAVQSLSELFTIELRCDSFVFLFYLSELKFIL